MFDYVFPKQKKKNKEYDYSYEEYDDVGYDYEEDELQKEIDLLKEQISETQTSYSALSTEMMHVKEENERLFNMNERIKNEADQKQREVDQITNKMMDYQDLVAKLKKALDHAKANDQEEQSKVNQAVSNMEAQQEQMKKEFGSENNKLKQLLVEESEKRTVEKEERTRLMFVIEKLKSEKKDVENELQKRIHQLQDELEKNSTENHSDKVEIADVLVEAKGISSRMIEQAEKKAQQIMSQAKYEAQTKVFEAEKELNELENVAHSLYLSVNELKDESAITFDKLVTQLSAFNKKDNVNKN
ncbi:hypothetical protein [Carnobacterium divergens]|uniref:hypothetical protein n=1 Tax=Carnobacterium divergens TaxID=2748 RepID=UPI0039B0234C